MGKEAEYLNYAIQALQLASNSAAPQDKMIRLEIAQRWLDMAEALRPPSGLAK